MTQILFGQSYFLRFDPKLWEAMQPYPPLGTLYAASYLRQHGYEVALFDALLAESEEEWAEALDQHQPQYAILYEDNFNYLSKMCLLRMREAAFKMIDMAKSRGCSVILCGADATDHYETYLTRGADYVLIGEGEETLIELLNQLSAGNARVEPGRNDTSQIIGLASTRIQPVKRRPDISNLDSLPFPAWDLVDVEKYRAIWLARHGYFSMNMVTTRGCPFHCNWCAKPIWGQRYHSRSPENVAAEMKWLRETYHPDHIWFVDDILGLKPGWLPRFADAVHAQGGRIPFKCLSRADLLIREGEVEALARAGAHTVWMGAESGSQKILDAMDKGTRVEQIHEAARRLKRAGIQVGFFLQFGYPGETGEDIEKTIQLVRDCDPDDIGISVSYPLPGTKFYQAVHEQLGEKQNWQDSQDLAMLYQGPFSTEFYRKLHGVVHKEFRARKAWKSITRTSHIDLNDGDGATAPLRRSESLRTSAAVLWIKKLRASASPLAPNATPVLASGASAAQRPRHLRRHAVQVSIASGRAGAWLRLGYNLLTLPVARIQLNRLASSQSRLLSLPHMSHEAAATPTPQEEQ